MNEKIESFDEVKQRVVGWVEWGLVGSGLEFERNPANTTLSIAYTYIHTYIHDQIMQFIAFTASYAFNQSFNHTVTHL